MKKVLAILLVAAMTLVFVAGCNGDSDDGVVTVTIPHYKVGDNVGATYFLPIVESFNERYEGRFHLIIEPMPQEMYTDQLLMLATAEMLPALIEGGLDDIWFRDIIIAENKFVDLYPIMSQQPVYRYFNPVNLQHNLTADGRLITVPNPMQRPMTMFYNEALWTPSRPIAEMSWLEVAADLGGERIAFMTAENSWTTILALSSIIAKEPGGAELLNDYLLRQERITDFSHPAFISAFETLQYLMANHAQDNVIGAAYREAAGAFFNLQAAIICNGPWMVGDIGPDGAETWHGPDYDYNTVRASVHPGNVAVFNPVGYGWWIPNTVPEEEQELALHFLAYLFSPENMEFTMTMVGGVIPGFNYTQEFLDTRAGDRLMNEYAYSMDANTLMAAPFFDVVVPSVVDDIGSLLPMLIDGTWTAQEFADELTRRTLAAIS